MSQENVKKIARLLTANAEQEVERFLRILLRDTEWDGVTKIVGGYTRDEVLGREPKDLDIVVAIKNGAQQITQFIHEQLPKETHGPHQLGAGYPIWQLTFKTNVNFKGEDYKTAGAVVEFADTMKESFPDKDSRQRKTEYGTLDEDVKRRDFTVNMLLKDVVTGDHEDLSGTSVKDIEDGVLRGHPSVDLNKIFSDDPLRMLRLVRICVKFDWDIPMSVLKTARKNAHRIKIVSAERVSDELKKIIVMGKLARAIRLMKATGLLQHVLPEIQTLKGITQSTQHHLEGDVLRHTLRVLEHAPATLEGQLAALLHDVGKPATREESGDKIHFLKHEDVGAEVARTILKRLKFDNETTDKVVTIVREHMRAHDMVDASEKSLRRFMRDLGDELTDAVVELAEADALGSLPVENKIPELKERIKKIKESPVKVKKQPVLNGEEIMRLLDVKAGPVVGEVGKFLLDKQDEYATEGRELEKEEAKSLVLNRFKRQASVFNRLVIAGRAEHEVERFLCNVLRDTEFSGVTKVVGGYIRDQLLREPENDIDIVVGLKNGAERLAWFLHRQFKTDVDTPEDIGKKFPMWRVRFNDDITRGDDIYETRGASVDIVDTMRQDKKGDFQFGTFSDDVKRRDFTIDMLLKDVVSGDIEDYTNKGIEDLRDKVLEVHPRADVDNVFASDPVRILRLVRLQNKFNLRVPQHIIDAAKRNAYHLESVSKKRIAEELSKMLEEGNVDKMIKMMRFLNVADIVLPELNNAEKLLRYGERVLFVSKILETEHPDKKKRHASLEADLKRAVKSVRELVHQGKPYPVAISQVSGETGVPTSDISDALRPFKTREKKITWKKPDLSRGLTETPEVTGLLKKMGHDTDELKTFLKTGRLTQLSRLDMLKKHVNMTLDETNVDERLADELSEKGRLTLEAPIIVRFTDGTYLGLSGDKSVNLALSESLPLVAWFVELPNRRPHPTSLF